MVVSLLKGEGILLGNFQKPITSPFERVREQEGDNKLCFS